MFIFKINIYIYLRLILFIGNLSQLILEHNIIRDNTYYNNYIQKQNGNTIINKLSQRQIPRFIKQSQSIIAEIT